MRKRLLFGDGSAHARRVIAVGARYSRFVGLMKLVLPLSAAVLVGLIVAWPYFTGRDGGVPLSFATIGLGPDEEVLMTNARYQGADDKEQPYTLTADVVTQSTRDSNVVQLTRPKADILLDGGAWLALTADNGVLRRAEEALSLAGGVNLYTDRGYEFRTERAEIDLEGRRAVGDAPIEGQGPFGVINADRFRLDAAERVLRFEGRVRLVVHPKAGV